MKRRTFVLGVGSATAGGSALLGTGAFTRVESHRQVDIVVAGDDEAYLQLYANPGNPVADALVNDDGDGHLTLDLESLNEHADLELDDLFSVCNHGKQPVCVWIEKEGSVVQCETPKHGRRRFPRPDPEGEGTGGSKHVRPPPGSGRTDERDAIVFYRGDDSEDRIDGVGTGEVLPVGDCVQVGVDLCTLGIDEGTELLPGGVTVYADVDGDCEVPDEPDDGDQSAISFVAFCGQNLDGEDFTYSVSETKDDDEPLEIEWEYHGDGTVETVVLKAGTWFYNVDASGDTSGTAAVGDGEAVSQFDGSQTPSKPCPGGGSGVRFEF